MTPWETQRKPPVKTLSAMHLVQFSFWDYETFNLRQGGTAFLGPNGAGKTSLADAVQIALVGAHGNHMHFNAQSVHKDQRSVRDYALGTVRSGEGDQGVLARKRDEALSYITLVFEGESPADVVSAGVCLHSVATEKHHRALGLYILPGVRLALEDHLGALDDGGKAPLDWPTFDALARRLAKQAGRTPTLTAKPETYLNELLHVLQHKGRTIDRDKFLRALAQSLRLKGIQSVNDYLRGYLVDAQPIDKQGTLKHIKTVRALVLQIEEVKQQIARLNDIDKRFNGVATQYRTRAVSAAVRSCSRSNLRTSTSPICCPRNRNSRRRSTHCASPSKLAPRSRKSFAATIRICSSLTTPILHRRIRSMRVNYGQPGRQT